MSQIEQIACNYWQGILDRGEAIACIMQVAKCNQADADNVITSTYHKLKSYQ